MLISDVSAVEYKSIENVHSVDSSLGFSLQAQIKKRLKIKLIINMHIIILLK